MHVMDLSRRCRRMDLNRSIDEINQWIKCALFLSGDVCMACGIYVAYYLHATELFSNNVTLLFIVNDGIMMAPTRPSGKCAFNHISL